MKRLRFLLVAVSVFVSLAASAEQMYPVASKDAQVIVGNARFTVLTPRLVRMEWAADGKFEDRASLGVINRNLPVPEFKVNKSANKLVIRTSDLTLYYRPDGKFSEDNLLVEFRMADPAAKKGMKKVIWKPGMDASANLLGTVRTLDGFDGENFKDPYDLGVCSRDGWAVMDESERQVFVPVDSDWQYWVENRPEGERQDWYFFGYGHDYMEAVADYTKIGGRIPMPPKYAFGYWWCRYWQYSDFEFIDLAEHFRRYSIPIDVMIIDMDWHETWNELKAKWKRDPAGQRIGWTGYTWKKELFPNPANFLEELHDYGVKTSLNLHFQSGVQAYEEPYKRFREDYLSRTDDYDGPKNYVNEDGTDAYVPYRMSQMAWADAYFNSIMHPMEEQGVDFWWMDWQQWKNSKYIEGLSNTFWLNYAFFNDKVRQSVSKGKYADRPMIYHRWGGLGSHRYQVGFSGDTRSSWEVLSYLPYFTATASNVGYGYWGHDIGGHMQPKGVAETDPELYTRWLQEGVFTPIFKTHSTKDLTMEKRFWVFPDHFDAMQEAVRLRYNLSAYIYNAVRQTYETGISMCRPLYYYYPETEAAYTWTEEFLFGDDILATVVGRPVDKVTGLAERPMWFPEGNDWYDMATGTMYKGGTTHELSYTIEENPYFVKAGTILPWAAPDIRSLQESTDEIWFRIIPGDGASSAVLYEDDGETQAYNEEFALTKVIKKSDAHGIAVTVAPREGSYRNMPATRLVRIALDGVFAPEAVKVNGKVVPYSRFAAREAAKGKACWGYDGAELCATVYLERADAAEELVVDCTYAASDADCRELLEGKKGLIKRMMALTPEAKYMFEKYVKHDLQLPAPFLDLAQCGSYITEDPANTAKYLRAVNVGAMNEDFAGFETLPEDFRLKAKAQSSM